MAPTKEKSRAKVLTTPLAFFKDEFTKREMARAQSKLTYGEMSKLAAEKWKELSKEDKEPYKKKADEAKEKNGTKKAGKENQGEKSKAKKKAKDPNAPKRPPPAYLLFHMKEQKIVRREYPRMSITDVSKEVGRRWRELSDADKEEFIQMANELKEKAAQEANKLNESTLDSEAAGEDSSHDDE